MNIAISGIGLATAQGSSSDILTNSMLQSPVELPWIATEWNVSRSCYRALDIDASLSGAERWQALVTKAFADLGEISDNTPLLVSSCNGEASPSWEQAFDTSVLLRGTHWANEPVFSSSCASGIHALYAAKQLLNAGALDEVLVLAADVLSQSNHDNFESLRVLAEKTAAPWQSTSTGFILGEAAVVLRLTRANEDSACLIGPELGSHLTDHDGLARVLELLSAHDPALILGQGTGPFQNDASELAALSSVFDRTAPLATPLTNFGHTLGASGLLAIALGALAQQKEPLYLSSAASAAMDGRPLFRSGTPRPLPQRVLAVCRALNGACAATVVGDEFSAKDAGSASVREGSLASCAWRKMEKPGPLMNRTLRRVAAEAFEHRPSEPPDILILRMEKPLSPTPSAIMGGRLLPSAVLEITPGFASQLIARCWGFSGPALCLVGDPDAEVYGFGNALWESGSKVWQVNLRGSGDNRVSEWNV